MIVEFKPAPEGTEPGELAGAQPLPPPCSRLVDRRHERRYATNDPARIKLLEAGLGQWMDGTVLDVSRGGLRIESPAAFGTGLRVQIVLTDRTVIFGVSRYCRQVSTRYQVGVAIEVVYCAQPVSGNHIQDNQLRLYTAGRGLTALQAIYFKNHLFMCGSCAARLAEAEIAQDSKSQDQQGPQCQE
ncbi:MAG TPA: PilZ domain-containing protein [Bryobacteraceae bacterium]|nr:PilZ domain-containing protein [Bryobacteraceae bacterium]